LAPATLHTFVSQREAAKRRFLDELDRIEETERLVTESESGYVTRREFSNAMGWSLRWTDELLAEDRIPGVVRVGRPVRIPRRLISHPEEIRGR
jgi:hypothetical protein